MCDKECFANLNGEYQCLDTPYVGDCPFQRTDITMQGQIKDIERYNSKKSFWHERFKENYNGIRH